MNDYTGNPIPSQSQPCYGCNSGGNQYSPTSAQGMSNPSYQGNLPTGYPTGPAYGPSPAIPPMNQGNQTQQPSQMPGGLNAGNLAPINALNQPMPITTQSLQYINGFLRTQIGRKVTVDFLIGTGTYLDKTGTLLAVGANYIILNETETNDMLVCDFYSIKFVTIYY